MSGQANTRSSFGRDIHYGVIEQGGAGTTQLVAADSTRHIRVVSYVVVLDATGTMKFADGAGNLSGAMPISATGGIVAPPCDEKAWVETAINSALSIVTTGGGAHGHFSYVLEP